MKALLRDLKADWEEVGVGPWVPTGADGQFVFTPRLWFRVLCFMRRLVITLTVRGWFTARYGEGRYWEYDGEKKDE